MDKRTCKHKGGTYFWSCKECRRVRMGEDEVKPPQKKIDYYA